MPDLTDILKSFTPIRLEDIRDVSLMDRIDTKYIIPTDKIAEYLIKAKDKYSVLVVNGNLVHPYETLYFDTPRYRLFKMHAKGVINRFKLRYRKYLDTGDAFFEIKTKTSDHRTVKKRIQIESLTQGLEGSLDQFLNQNTKTNYENYQPVLTVYFNRVTLVNKYENERLTIDTEIYYTDNLKTVKRLDNIAIIEFKRDEFFKSSFEIILEQNEVEQSEMSKYCLGIKFLKKRVHNRSWSKINMLTDLPDFD